MARSADSPCDPRPMRNHPDPPTLIDVLQASAARHGVHGYTFIADRLSPETHLSFSDLDRRARAVAAYLLERDLRGQRILLCPPPGLDFLVGLFGCLYAGAVAVPLYPSRANRADSRLDAVAADAGAALVLTAAKTLQDRDRLTRHAARLRELDWLDAGAVPPAHADAWSRPDFRPDDVAILQYTSGSTGQPKGVILTHAALLHNIRRMAEVLTLSAEQPAVSWLPAFHDMGLIGNFLQGAYSGLNLTFLPPAAFVQDPLLWLELIHRRRAYISGGPTFAFRHCVQRLTPERCQGLDLSCWRRAYVGAEPILPTVLDDFARLLAPCGFRREAFFPCYGLAEATLMVSGGSREATPRVRSFCRAALGENRVVGQDSNLDTSCQDRNPDPRAGQAMVGCGQPLRDLDVRIVDPDTGATLPANQIGEVWVSGP